MGTNGTHEVPSLPIPTARETVAVVTVRDCYVSSVFTSYKTDKSQVIKPLCDGAYCFSPLIQKTWMSNHWQMQNKGCAFLLVPLGHFKLLNANSAGMWTRANHSELGYSTNWTKHLQSAVLNGFGKPSPRGGGGVLPYITYTGMCRPTGSWFWSSWFRTGYPFQRRFLERGIKKLWITALSSA